MALHFDAAEYDARLRQLTVAIRARGLDGLLLFAQESMYWLTATTPLASASSNASR